MVQGKEKEGNQEEKEELEEDTTDADAEVDQGNPGGLTHGGGHGNSWRTFFFKFCKGKAVSSEIVTIEMYNVHVESVIIS